MWGAISMTYVFYLTGTLYIVGAAVGWTLFALVLLRTFVEGKAAKDSCVPVVIWIWILSMLVMLVALLMAHANYDLSMGQTIKSSVGWAKGWALLALLPLLGAIASVRPKVIIRACCILSSQAVVFVGIGIVLAVVNFHGQLYLSPLKAVGGPISAFEVGLYGLNPETGRARWSFFAPWAPAAGLMSCLLLVICLQEKDQFWRRMGIFGALCMCLFCQSRAGWAIFIAIPGMLIFFNRVRNPLYILAAGVAFSALILLGEPLFELAGQTYQDIKDSRADSTRVRSTLANLALQRWESEAPIWGHGIVERGPKIVEFMPIGSHHSWYGLLFVKGIVGLFALAIPMAATIIYFLCASLRSQRARSALVIMIIFLGYSFFENLEILAYIFWPIFLWLGIALNPIKLTIEESQISGAH